MDTDWNGSERRNKRSQRNVRDGGRDCVALMQLARCRADALEEALAEMGFTEANDNFPDDE